MPLGRSAVAVPTVALLAVGALVTGCGAGDADDVRAPSSPSVASTDPTPAASAAADPPARALDPASDVLEAGSGASAVRLARLAEGVWMHTSTGVVDGAQVPANGLVVLAPEGAVLVDTPWTVEQTAVLDDLIASAFQVEVVGAVVTHAHADRMGGAPYLVANGVPITALSVVAEQAAATGYVVPDDVHDGEWAAVTIGGADLELYFPGAGHTRDSTVVWLPSTEILFGGCQVKDLATTRIRPSDDTDLAAWPGALDNIWARYGAAAVVVPGHGEPGDLTRLLDHTRSLLGG